MGSNFVTIIHMSRFTFPSYVPLKEISDAFIEEATWPFSSFLSVTVDLLHPRSVRCTQTLYRVEEDFNPQIFKVKFSTFSKIKNNRSKDT